MTTRRTLRNITICNKQAARAGRQLIDDASLGPEASKALRDAFDAAWLEIAGNFSTTS